MFSLGDLVTFTTTEVNSAEKNGEFSPAGVEAYLKVKAMGF